MADTREIISELRSRGERMTPIRGALLKIFTQNKSPRSSPQLLAALENKGFSANKTTVYRQLEMLRKSGIIGEVNFNDGVKRYELADSGHHHHLICLECDQIDDVVLPASLEPRAEIASLIKRAKKFIVARHSLEFFGVCRKCRKGVGRMLK